MTAPRIVIPFYRGLRVFGYTAFCVILGHVTCGIISDWSVIIIAKTKNFGLVRNLAEG